MRKCLHDLGVGFLPKKMKLALAFRCQLLETTALGFNEVYAVSGEEPIKRKRGRPVGAKNKEKFMKKTALVPLRLTYLDPSFCSALP